MWQYVIENFNLLLTDLSPTKIQLEDRDRKLSSINTSLNAVYYPDDKLSKKAFLAGSHMKGVAIRPLTDIDIHYLLPEEDVKRFMKRIGNQPSQLLQEVKLCLEKTFPATPINADGQVVSLDFSTVKVEVIPVFLGQDGLVYYCDSNDGGTFRACSPKAEFDYIQSHDNYYGGKARHLISIIKGWNLENNVFFKSVAIEILCCEFLKQWRFNDKNIFYYDWMIRDFFELIKMQVNASYVIPGTNEVHLLGENWMTKALRAHKNALEACNSEYNDWGYLAREEWSKIFGARFQNSFALNTHLGKAA